MDGPCHETSECGTFLRLQGMQRHALCVRTWKADERKEKCVLDSQFVYASVTVFWACMHVLCLVQAREIKSNVKSRTAVYFRCQLLCPSVVPSMSNICRSTAQHFFKHQYQHACWPVKQSQASGKSDGPCLLHLGCSFMKDILKPSKFLGLISCWFQHVFSFSWFSDMNSWQIQVITKAFLGEARYLIWACHCVENLEETDFLDCQNIITTLNSKVYLACLA